ncbi:MAG TPA: hypothetical protein VE422_05960, partial [Terriglobia bacterium]|nr:hypothetical protein [Terriglobia bacterium]
MRSIKALNQRDVDAALASDADRIMSQWSDDIIMLPPVGPIMRGRSANAEIVQKGMEQVHAFEPLEHVVDFEEIKVNGPSTPPFQGVLQNPKEKRGRNHKKHKMHKKAQEFLCFLCFLWLRPLPFKVLQHPL